MAKKVTPPGEFFPEGVDFGGRFSVFGQFISQSIVGSLHTFYDGLTADVPICCDLVECDAVARELPQYFNEIRWLLGEGSEEGLFQGVRFGIVGRWRRAAAEKAEGVFVRDILAALPGDLPRPRLALEVVFVLCFLPPGAVDLFAHGHHLLHAAVGVKKGEGIVVQNGNDSPSRSKAQP